LPEIQYSSNNEVILQHANITSVTVSHCSNPKRLYICYYHVIVFIEVRLSVLFIIAILVSHVCINLLLAHVLHIT